MKLTKTNQHTTDYDRLWEGLFRGQYLTDAPALKRFSRVPKDEEGELADAGAI
jgi:hypothetical protein